MTPTFNVGIGSPSLRALKARLLSVSTALVILWAFVVWWGERTVFQTSVSQCHWAKWETWPSQSNPHHLLLVADPQLVDPHTYPGRPWPLSTLTILYTDLYLRRSYDYLQHTLYPDSTLFLGDLFDGGREWSTAKSSSPEQRYRKYGTAFWLKEYLRFSKIFLRSWTAHSSPTTAAPMGRRIIASVPGNHDLGFASGIQVQVKSRFDAYFGPLNRVDVIGNHSVVSLDTVSLSAMDQIDPQTGSSGAGDGSVSTAHSNIWKPVEDFLMDARKTRDRAIQREHRSMTAPAGKAPRFQPDLVSLSDTSKPPASQSVVSTIRSSQFPTIVLSHVPLYRGGGTSCGPNRERGDSIPIQAGYQYQNVLTPLISQDIVKHLNPEEIAMIYSGDDHDYCEIEHSEFTGRIREITVKSMSWAMGVRKPGVQLVSLWNPIDMDQISSSSGSSQATPRDTVQNHLCLLPDQLSIFIRYAQLLGVTIILLAIHAIRSKPQRDFSTRSGDKSEPLLPLSHTDTELTHHRTKSASQISTTSASSLDHQQQSLSTRKAGLGGYGNLPAFSRSSSPSKPHPPFSDQLAPPFTSAQVIRADSDDWSTSPSSPLRSNRRKGSQNLSRLREFGRNVRRVAVPVLCFYFWLLWNG